MIYIDNDYKLFAEYFPFYVNIFEKYDSLLKAKYNSELAIRIRDSNYNDYIVITTIGNNKKYETKINLIIKEINEKINNTCCKCGKSPAIFRGGYSNSIMYNESVLCEECYNHNDKETDILAISSFFYFSSNFKVNDYRKIKIRYINPFDEFDYAKFGKYFFIDDELYIITKNKKYASLDVKKKLRNKIYSAHLTNKDFVIKSIYAGQDTGFRDDYDKRIYTGDIVINEGFSNPEREPYSYYKKNRNSFENKDQVHYYKVCGAVSAIPSQYYKQKNHPIDKIYQVVLNNHGAFLSHSIKIEIIGNVFYNLNRESKINIEQLAASFAQSGFYENGFWKNYSIETAKEGFRKIKKPSFNQPRTNPKKESKTRMFFKRFFNL
jgi:hypothetical protein